MSNLPVGAGMGDGVGIGDGDGVGVGDGAGTGDGLGLGFGVGEGAVVGSTNFLPFAATHWRGFVARILLRGKLMHFSHICC